MNKLPKAQKSQQSFCDKRRNRQRKLLKAKTKLAMGCLNKQCWYGKYRMPYSIQLRWYGGLEQICDTGCRQNIKNSQTVNLQKG